MMSVLDIKILLKCNDHAISMRDVSQLYKSSKKDDRDKTIKNLEKQGYIEVKSMPKPNTKKSPTYYFISDKGKLWVKEYLEQFPKR